MLVAWPWAPTLAVSRWELMGSDVGLTSSRTVMVLCFSLIVLVGLLRLGQMRQLAALLVAKGLLLATA
jgi:hypothetical protein